MGDPLAYFEEGLPIPLPSSSVPFQPDCFYTTVTQTIDGVVTEDWNQPEPSAHSLCVLLAGLRLDDLCTKCEGATLLVGASSQDFCLKQIGDVFYRETCQNPDGIGHSDSVGYHSSPGSYSLDGYASILRFAPSYVMAAGDPEVICNQLRLDFLNVDQTPPAQMSLRVGHSAAPADPNSDTERIVWRQFSAKDLMVMTTLTPAQHVAANSNPASLLRWVMHSRARVLYLELTQAGTGGDCQFSAVQAEIKPHQVRDA